MTRHAALSGKETGPESSTDSMLLPLVMPAGERALRRAKSDRNSAWRNNPAIPHWVDPEKVDLDRFFTRPDVARECHEHLVNAMVGDNAVPGSYKFVEPSAGEGAFYDLLPEDRRIGIDIVPGRHEFLREDFLAWKPSPNGYRYAVLGNPPFGYRAWLALAFVNHAASFADYIGMILPMAFQSNGKGSPKFRVVGAELVETRILPQDAFVSPEGQTVKVNALWQVWKRGVNNHPPMKACSEYVDLFTVDKRAERLCGHERMHEADWFLQRTFYGDPPGLVTDFADVRYGCGYGIVIRKAKQRVTQVLRQTDWREYSNLAAHNCRHISKEHIRAALVDAGISDDA